MKIALYFDCQNVSHIFLSDVLGYCQKERYDAVIKRAYKDFTKHCGWDEVLRGSDIKPVQVFGSKLNSADISLCLDALWDASKCDQIDAFCIVSSDCDFIPLIIKLKQMGKIVLGFGERKTKRQVKEAYSNFILLSRQVDQTCDFSDIIEIIKANLDSDGYARNAKIIKILQDRGGKISSADYGYLSWREFYESKPEFFKLNPDFRSDLAVALA